MANTLITPQVVANEALIALQGNLVMADLVHRDYSDEFQKVGDTVTIRKPAKFVAKNFTGSISTQNITEGSTTVKLDRLRDVSVNVTAKELTLDIKDFREQVIVPAMQAIAQAVDEDLLAIGVEKAGSSVSATANPTNLADIANLAKELDLNKVPTQNRRLVLNPNHKYKYALTDNLSKVSYAGDNITLRDALLGRVYAFDTYMDQNAPDGAKSKGTATGYKVEGTAGNAYVALSDVASATATIKVGDGFIYNGYTYRFTENATAVASAIASVAIDQPLVENIASSATILPLTAPNSLAFHRNGIALVTRNLELPLGASQSAIASADGLSVRVVYGYDQVHKQDTISFDILYGVKVLDDDLVVKLV